MAMMRILLFNLKTRRFYKGPGEWVEETKLAHEFRTGPEALAVGQNVPTRP